ncbi:MAG TPA: choline/ethanolamine kinase family protein, partial [Solirubrobacteraceae bacterium]|nr:choline/ethanolamine kinase family protein [Solirubrobacteraceae bacterium]
MGTAGATDDANDVAASLRVLEPLLGVAAGAPVPLHGGITNRNYVVRLGDRDYVVRLPGGDRALLGISGDGERLASESAAALGIAPGVAVELASCLVTEFVDARQLPQAELRRSPEPVARALRSFHEQGPALPTRFDVPRLLDSYAAIVNDRGGTLPAQYPLACKALMRIDAALPAMVRVPCHNDLLIGNLLQSVDGRVMIVDWEYAGMGDRYFDLGNLSVNNDFEPDDDERLLAAYLGL